ncbi:TAXI family TRAP transporter solute-binding subunit [Lederbergia graminis]|uniref:TAXI family TRAP transporter solute-binding subunit n=1 Tax=Lederbergia graminis TaxID=735518 RepID=A0ABW0LEP6_9BACI
MKGRSKLIISVLTLLVVSIVIAGCGKKDGNTIRIGSGPSGGPNYMIVAGISNLVTEEFSDYNISTEITTGSQENIRMIAQGDAQFGISMVDAAYNAYNGTREYDKDTKEKINFVMGGPATLIHFMVKADSDIQSINDLKGKSVGVARGVMGQYYMPIILEAYGLTDKDVDVKVLELADISNALADGTIDAGAHITPFPETTTSDLAVTQGIRLLEFEENIANKIIEENPYFFLGEIDGGTYSGIDNTVKTIGTRNVLIASTDVDEETVYNFVKVIDEKFEKLKSIHPQADAFNRDNALGGQLFPIHPGAEKYYKEIGVLE